MEIRPAGRVAANLQESDNRTVMGHVCLVTVLWIWYGYIGTGSSGNGTLRHCTMFSGIASGLVCCGDTPSVQSGCQPTGKGQCSGIGSCMIVIVWKWCDYIGTEPSGNGTLRHCITFAGIASGLVCRGDTPSMQSNGSCMSSDSTLDMVWLHWYR